jgi:hypothetical protein
VLVDLEAIIAIQMLFVVATSAVPEPLYELYVTKLETFNEAVSFVCIAVTVCPFETTVYFVELLYLKLSIGAGKVAILPVAYPPEPKLLLRKAKPVISKPRFAF